MPRLAIEPRIETAKAVARLTSFLLSLLVLILLLAIMTMMLLAIVGMRVRL